MTAEDKLIESVITPKERMLRAYRGEFSDRYPVAPEFWCYYPAMVLGVSMIELEREIPHWKALLHTFKKYDTEGWGVIGPDTKNPDLVVKAGSLKKIEDGQYRQLTEYHFDNSVFTEIRRYSEKEPCWLEKHLLDGPEDLDTYINMVLNDISTYNFKEMNNAYSEIGGTYLCEANIGATYFDFIAGALGFEEAVIFFKSADEDIIDRYSSLYTEYKLDVIKKTCSETEYESFFIGCTYSCVSLLGPELWRKYDKPFIKAMAEEVHKHGKLLHIHFHGKSMAVIDDLAQLGVDCICPFERGPGGDIDTKEDLEKVRKALDDKVTFNGNVHTVNTLIFGTPELARNEVKELKQAFINSPRLIIGTGDQVSTGTKEEILYAMIEEAKKPINGSYQ